MNYSEIIIGLSGGIFGGVVVAIIQYFLDKRKAIELNFNKLMEDKYRSLLVFMTCALDIENRRHFTINEQIPTKKSQDYLDKIKEYYYHSVLYSPDEVILALKQFIKTPTIKTYIKTATAMRKDLWNKGTKLKFEDIILDNKLQSPTNLV